MNQALRTAEIQGKIGNLWTVQDFCDHFKVTPMTVHLWRRHRNLPAVVIPGKARPSVRFVPEDVLKWAEDIGVTVSRMPLLSACA